MRLVCFRNKPVVITFRFWSCRNWANRHNPRTSGGYGLGGAPTIPATIFGHPIASRDTYIPVGWDTGPSPTDCPSISFRMLL